METTSFSRDFFLEDLRVLGIKMHSVTPGPEEETGAGTIVWSGTFYDPDRALGDEGARVLICSLHAHAEDGWGTITVGGVLTPLAPAPSDPDELTALIANSVALETMYDFARITFKTLAGTVDLHLQLPYKSPEATIEQAENKIIVKDYDEAGVARPQPAEIEAAHNH